MTTSNNVTPQQLEEYRSSEFIEETYKFWFSDNQHVRSPIPSYIQSELKTNATDRFLKWVGTLGEGAKDEVKDEIVAEKFEEIIFEEALQLVLTDDERISLQYPFLPRTGDEINDETHGASKIVDRALLTETDFVYLRVKLETNANGEKWETKFELPL